MMYYILVPRMFSINTLSVVVLKMPFCYICGGCGELKVTLYLRCYIITYRLQISNGLLEGNKDAGK